MSSPVQTRISVVIAAYNAASTLAETLDSVLNQTRPADEILVVDDGSTDETAAVAARFADAGVRLLQQPNAGPSAARNRGAQATTGDYLAFLDADDLWHPTKLQAQLAYLEATPAAVLVSCQRWRWQMERDHRFVERFGARHPAVLLRELCVRNVVGNTSMPLLRRSAFERAGGFNEAIRWAEEWDLWLRMAPFGTLWVLPEPLMTYRAYASSLSSRVVWEKGARHFRIAHDGIHRLQPAWLRPWLLARAWSDTEYFEARTAIQHRLPRRVQLHHAFGALFAYPFERTRDKLRAAADALIGPDLIAQLLAAVPGLRRRARA